MTLNIVNFMLDYNVSLHSIGGVNVCYVIDRDWIFVLLAEASGCHKYFAHTGLFNGWRNGEVHGLRFWRGL